MTDRESRSNNMAVDDWLELTLGGTPSPPPTESYLDGLPSADHKENSIQQDVEIPLEQRSSDTDSVDGSTQHGTARQQPLFKLLSPQQRPQENSTQQDVEIPLEQRSSDTDSVDGSTQQSLFTLVSPQQRPGYLFHFFPILISGPLQNFYLQSALPLPTHAASPLPPQDVPAFPLPMHSPSPLPPPNVDIQPALPLSTDAPSPLPPQNVDIQPALPLPSHAPSPLPPQNINTKPALSLPWHATSSPLSPQNVNIQPALSLPKHAASPVLPQNVNIQPALPLPTHAASPMPPLSPPRQPRQRRKLDRPLGNDRSVIINPPYPWATNRRATVQSLEWLKSNGIDTITGSVKCKECEKQFEIEYDLENKFREIARFICRYKHLMHRRAPQVYWMNPVFPDCSDCNKEKCIVPVVGKKRMINWLFLLLGRMLGSCTLNELKYFCKHNGNHKSAAKDRVLYSTYMGICKQLDPKGPYDVHD